MSFNLFAGPITIKDQWIKSVPPMAKMSAAYMTITNNSKKDISLLEASSNIAKAVELHTHFKVDGIMKMRKVESIKIPAQSSTQLKPKSYHIMFIGLKEKLPEGKEVKLKLKFSNGEKLELNAIAKKLK